MFINMNRKLKVFNIESNRKACVVVVSQRLRIKLSTPLIKTSGIVCVLHINTEHTHWGTFT